VRARKDKWLLKLYVSGRSPLAASARANLERLCAQNIKSPYRIEVIDLLEHPTAAREHEIVAVPTVVREAPVPIRKAVGDLSDLERALFALQLSPAAARL
jgi:circadian clock protein KaiB